MRLYLTIAVNLALVLHYFANEAHAEGTFGDVFAWGASSSAFQIEGAWNVDGKGENIWDKFARDKASARNGDNGDNTSDGYYRYKEDVGYLKKLKVTHYAFSISWSRIYPDGNNINSNIKAIQYYKNLVNELVANNIKPVVTLYQYDLPQALQQAGGWTSENTINKFVEYAEYMFTNLGDKVKTWVTIYDPYSVAYRGYGDGSYAPGVKQPQTAPYNVGHNLIKAHSRVYDLYKRQFKTSQNGNVGIVLKSDWFVGATVHESASALRAKQFSIGWFASPLLGNGDYLNVMKNDASTRLPSFTDAEKALNKGSVDFVGISVDNVVSVAVPTSPASLEIGYVRDRNVETSNTKRLTEDALVNMLMYMKTTFNNPEIHMFDAGYGDCGTNYDEDRIQYMKTVIAALRKSLTTHKVRISGFFTVFMDGYNWEDGFNTKRGLYHVETRANKDRMDKASARFYQTLIQNKGEHFDYPPHFVGDVIREKDDFLREKFPAGFHWGVATAAYQIEGGWNADGKGPSIWDVFAHDNKLANGDTGDVACDSYHKYKRDVQMVKALGVSHYRFSIAWSRLLPNGRKESLNPAAVTYYNNVINELLANGIQPMVTLYHWDLPQALQEIGGWENDSIIEYFNDYARICFEQFGDRVPMWITFNEAFAVSWLGYGIGVFAPGINSPGTGAYMVAHNIIRSHVAAWHTYDDDFRHLYHGKVGITLDCDWKHPLTSDAMDRYAAERALQFKLGWFANPIFGNGDYPAVMRYTVDKKSREEGRSESRLPRFTDEEKKMNKGSYDFFGLNHYTTQYIRHNHDDRHNDYGADQDLYEKTDDCWPGTVSGWLKVNPWGLRYLLRWVKDRYNNPPLYITENGVSDDGSLDDQNRIDYYNSYTNEMLKAIKRDGCNVKGYVAWSLMDNLEWTSGYTQKFGIYRVNFTDPERTRTPKKSAAFYTKLVRDNGYV